MYKKIARVGPISFGIFYALTTLLMIIIAALVGAFLLPLLPRQEGVPELDIIAQMSSQLFSGEGLATLGISLGFMLLGSFLIGFIVAIIYNIVAMITGGIKVRVTDLGYDDI